jgi:pyruvate kinase
MMDRVARYTEASEAYAMLHPQDLPGSRAQESITAAIGEATYEVAKQLGASAIVTATSTGHTAITVSRFRPQCPIIAATCKEEIYQRLALVWGVYPVRVPDVDNSDGMMQECINAVQTAGIAKDGDIVVLTGGVPVNRPGSTNFLKVHRIGQSLLMN